MSYRCPAKAITPLLSGAELHTLTGGNSVAPFHRSTVAPGQASAGWVFVLLGLRSRFEQTRCGEKIHQGRHRTHLLCRFVQDECADSPHLLTAHTC